jgi:two-component system NarL family response regulator
MARRFPAVTPDDYPGSSRANDVELLIMTESNLSNIMNGFRSPPQETARIGRENSLDTTRIFIIGYQDFSVDGLASMLEARDGGYRVSCAEPDEECMAKFAATRPDALLIQNDSLPQPFERFISEVTQHCPDIRVLVFGKGMGDDHLYGLVRAGVHGYINERMDGDHFKRALDHVLDGNTWVERHILERFIAGQQSFDELLESQFSDRIEQLCERLTKRETEILCEVIKGLAIKQIAESVHLSHQGVKMHLAKLFKKFNVNNRNQLILAAFDEMSPIQDLSVLLRNGLNKKLKGKTTHD